MFIICYIRQRIRQRNSSNTTTQPSRIRNPLYSTTQPSRIRNPTYSTTQPENVQITTDSTTQPESLQNKNYSTNQQRTLTSLPPPSYESVCNLPPSYSHATDFASVGVNPNIVPTTNSGQNIYTVPMSNNISGNNSNPNNTNPEQIDLPTTIGPVENVSAGEYVFESDTIISD